MILIILKANGIKKGINKIGIKISNCSSSRQIKFLNLIS